VTVRLSQFFDQHSEPVGQRVAVALSKLGLALKQQAWTQASQDGLSPTQGQILSALSLEGALTGSELAARLGVSLPTVSDAVRVLVEKGALEKRPDPRHPRASLLSLTPHGAELAKRVSTWPDFLAASVGELSKSEQEAVLSAVLKMIRSLQQKGLIPVSRMCVSCKYFQPNVHEGELPHHCGLVDAAMAGRHLRVECPEHVEADAAERDAAWERFVSR
jgi:DNA-binding MarR family transcriptional regulator